MKKVMVNERHGFTLIELTIYGGLLGILLLILSEFFITIVNLQLKIETTTAIDQDSEYINARMAYDIRRATSIESPLFGGSDDEFSLTVSENQPIDYTLAGTDLVLTGEGGTARLNSDRVEVSNFAVTRVGNSGSLSGAKDTLRIFYTLESVGETQSGTAVRSFETTISLR